MKKNIIVTGIGQDGYFLSKQLIEKGFFVVGIDRWQDKGYNEQYKELMAEENFKLVEGDICDRYLIRRLLEKYKPVYFFNTAAISHVGVSFEIPERVTEVNYVAVIRMLEEIRSVSPETSFLQCSTSEQCGDNTETPQNENTKMLPNSPYAIAKTASFFMVKLFRKYGLKTYNTICFNHESYIRPENFVTRKIIKALVGIEKGNYAPLVLGNIESKRDFGWAPDYTKAMIMMVESGKPDDYVVCTGVTVSIRNFIEETCNQLGFSLEWRGSGLDEIGWLTLPGKSEVKPLIKISKDFYRPAEVNVLCGDASKIKNALGWEPEHDYYAVIRKIIEHERKQ